MREEVGRPDELPPQSRYLPALMLLFVGSGCAALIYEIVWFQMLQLVIGATGVSLGLLLGTFMGGMFLGSLALPRFVSIDRSPLRVYAAIELAIGVLGIAILVLMPAVNGFYAAVVPRGFGSVLVRAVLCGMLLIPPTVLMGATLPAIARQVDATPRGLAWMGYFYSGNIVGAVLGCLLAGFYLLRLFDIPTATFVAFALNVVVAASAFGLARLFDADGAARGAGERSGADSAGSRATSEDRSRGAAVVVRSRAATAPRAGTGDGWLTGRRAIYLAIAASGLAALGSEVIWTRLLSLLLGTTTYTFSLILAVFLTGLGGGSSLGSRLARSAWNPRYLFGAFQLLAVASIAYSAYVINGVLPFLAVPEGLWAQPWRMLAFDIGRCALAILPAPVCWGASFPLAVAAAADSDADPGRLMGGVYAANTAGAILGALGGGLVLVPLVGTHGGLRLLLVVSALAAAALFAPTLVAHAGSGPASMGRARGSWLVGCGVAVLLGWSLMPTEQLLITEGRHAPRAQGEDLARVLYVGEGLNASVAVTEEEDSVRTFRISGKVAASTWPEDMILQRMLGHFSGLFHEQPRTVLIVGFGAGVTAGTFVTQPGIERIVICEIEPLATEETAHFFAEANQHVLDDPRVEVIHDDARHFLLTTDEKFDVITSDPIHPWVKGAAALYTEEYFQLARRHLEPGGVITQWVPLYESTMPVVMSELATFTKVFPEATLWSSHLVSEGFDLVMAARPDGFEIDIEELDERMAAPEFARALASLSTVGIRSADDVLKTYVASGSDLAGWLSEAEVNRDRSLRLMYLAGLGLNAEKSNDIHNEIFRYRTFPERILKGPPERLEFLRKQIIGEII